MRQAALEYLESIIIYPPGMEPKDEEGKKINGVDVTDEGSPLGG
jgi:hypothetical protein